MDEGKAIYPSSDEILNIDTKLTQVTHVCQHWRTISVNDSTLWNAPCSEIGYSWDLEMSSRAQRVPLIVSHTIATYEDWSYTVQMLPRHIPHTKELSVRATKQVMGDILERAFSLSAPLLSELDLCELGYDDEPVPDPDLIENTEVEYDVCVPPVVFEHHRLERLRLNGIPLPRALTSFHNLVSLSLIKSVHFDGDSEEDRLTPSNILLILQSLPKLQELLLRRCFLDHTYSSSPSSQRVHLNDLRSLDIHDGARAVHDLLEGLVVPPSSSISLHLWVHPEVDSFHSEGPIASIFGGSLAAHVSSARIRTMSIEPHFSFRVENEISIFRSYAKIMAWPLNLLLHGPVDPDSTLHRPSLSISWDYTFDSDDLTFMLPRILEWWNTSHVEALLLRHATVSRLFGIIIPSAFPNVQQMSLYGLTVPYTESPPYLDALRAVLLGLDSEEASRGGVTYPKLTYLAVHCRDFFGFPPPQLAISQWRCELLALLEARRAIRNHLPSPTSLHFIGWPKTMVHDAKFLRELKEIVPEVRSDPM